MARILIIDDDPHIGEALRLALAGHRVEVATGAADGLLLARERSWDLILLDHLMPGRSGLDVLPQLHLAAPDVPILMLTAVDAVGVARDALGSGARGYLTKPISLPVLRRTVEQTLSAG